MLKKLLLPIVILLSSNSAFADNLLEVVNNIQPNMKPIKVHCSLNDQVFTDYCTLDVAHLQVTNKGYVLIKFPNGQAANYQIYDADKYYMMGSQDAGAVYQAFPAARDILITRNGEDWVKIWL